MLRDFLSYWPVFVLAVVLLLLFSQVRKVYRPLFDPDYRFLSLKILLSSYLLRSRSSWLARFEETRRGKKKKRFPKLRKVRKIWVSEPGFPPRPELGIFFSDAVTLTKLNPEQLDLVRSALGIPSEFILAYRPSVSGLVVLGLSPGHSASPPTIREIGGGHDDYW